jgi:hypothetical protein
VSQRDGWSSTGDVEIGKEIQSTAAARIESNSSSQSDDDEIERNQSEVPTAASESLKLNSNNSGVATLERSTRDSRELQAIDQLASRDMSLIPSSVDSSSEIVPVEIDAGIVEDRVSVMGGVVFWNMGYGSEEPQRAQFEEALVSYSGGVQYTHVFRNGFFGMLGLNMVQLESRFEWSQAINNYTVTLTDTITEVQVNALTGEYTTVRGDVDVSVNAERQVIHYNTTRLIQVPLAVGKSWRWGRWQADLMVGGVLNVQSMNRGRTLFEGELVDYDDSSTDFMSNQWKVHGMGAANITYRVTEQFGITGGFQFQKSISNWSTEENISMRPYLFGAQVGLTYTF